MARRNVLRGASTWEREEKVNQQRDYAAQLQEQVLQKQAKQEQEKARRRQEQHEEKEILERERAAATGKLQPQQESTVPDPVSPVASPQRSASMPHASTVDLQQHIVPTESPLQSGSAGPGSTSVRINPGVPLLESVHDSTAPLTTNVGYESSMPSFNSTPSIFASLLREPGIGARSVAFYDELAALQRLAIELDSTAKQKRRMAQNNYAKPDFLHQEETEVTPTNGELTALPSPIKFDDEKVVIQANNQQDSNQHRVPPPRTPTSFGRLLGESVLLPLSATKLPSCYSPTRRATASPTKPWQRATNAAESEDNYATMCSLDNHSEMLPFTQY